MPKFVKTVTTEVVDEAKISMALKKRLAELHLLGSNVVFRLVMSNKTKDAIRCAHTMYCLTPTVATIKAADSFEGHPVDINDSLEFGEVLFTAEL